MLAFDGRKGRWSRVVGTTAAIRLTEEVAATRVACDADVQAGGLIAAAGAWLIEATARKRTDNFFSSSPARSLRVSLASA